MKFLLDGEQSERLVFRSVRASDFDQWLEFFKDPMAHRHWVAERPVPDQECADWYARQNLRYQNNEGGMNALVERSTGRLVGHCGLLMQNVDGVQELEIGYSLLPAFWKQGYATEAARKCRDFAFTNKLSPSLISIISVTNTSSENVALKIGMTFDKATIYKKKHLPHLRSCTLNCRFNFFESEASARRSFHAW
jgi:ribosomal-protein-alanine N-acetyltransferase